MKPKTHAKRRQSRGLWPSSSSQQGIGRLEAGAVDLSYNHMNKTYKDKDPPDKPLWGSIS